MFRISYLLIATAFVLSAQSCRSAKPTFVATTTPEPTPNIAAPKVEVASYTVQIGVRKGKCFLTYAGPHKGELVTDLPAPCEFSRGHQGTIQTREFPRRGPGGGRYTVIVIIGGPLNTDHSDRFMTDGCGTQVQPFSLSPRGVALGDAEALLIVCPLEDLDTAVFGFSARPV